MKEHALPSGPDSWTSQAVLFCGHAGTFVADVFVTPFAVTVLSKGLKPVLGSTLDRRNVNAATWHICDSRGGYFRPQKGIFVLPREAVTRLTDANRDQFL